MIAEPSVAVHLRALDPFDFLERAAFVYPDKVAVIDGTARRTYPVFVERVRPGELATAPGFEARFTNSSRILALLRLAFLPSSN